MEIENLPQQNIAYIQRKGPYGPENYAVMDAIKSWAWSKGLLSGGTIYGIALDIPDLDPERCRYMACVVIDDPSVADDRVRTSQLPGGRYAVFKVKHDAESVDAFWSNFFDTLDANGLTLDNIRPIMERYREKMILQGMCEFCIPVQ